MDLILEKFNVGGFRWINDLAGHNVWLDRFMIFAADKMGYLLILFVFILFWKRSYSKKAIFISLGSAVVARFIFVGIFRYFLYSPRPFLVLDNVNRLMNHELESSFPSGHAAFYFAMAMGVYLSNKNPAPTFSTDRQYNRGWGWCGAGAGYTYLILAGLMGFARIFVSVHWPLDILAGAVLGIITAVLINYLKQKVPLRALGG